MRSETVKELLKARLIIKLKGLTTANCIEVVGTLIDCGVTAIEILDDRKSGFAVLKKVIYYFSKEIETKKLLVGVGKILTPTCTIDVIKIGVNFITSPVLSNIMVEISQHSKTLLIAGVATPAEMLQAYEKRLDFVQLFPAAAFDVKYAKMLIETFPSMKMMVSGGIKLIHIDRYFRNGVSLVAIGRDVITAKQCGDNRHLLSLKNKLSIYVPDV